MSEQEEEKKEERSSDDSRACDASGNHLFEMKGSSKMHWHFVRLVAKKGSDMKTVKSKDAMKAFCLLCHKDIKYTKGNGNSVLKTRLYGGERTGSGIHGLQLLRGNGYASQLVQLHQSVFSLIVVLH